MKVKVNGWAAQRAARFAAARTPDQMREELKRDGYPGEPGKLDDDMARAAVLSILQYFVRSHVKIEAPDA